MRQHLTARIPFTVVRKSELPTPNTDLVFVEAVERVKIELDYIDSRLDEVAAAGDVFSGPMLPNVEWQNYKNVLAAHGLAMEVYPAYREADKLNRRVAQISGSPLEAVFIVSVRQAIVVARQALERFV